MNSRSQISSGERFDDNPIAIAISVELTTKYTSADSTTAGTTMSAGPVSGVPPVATSVAPAANIESVSVEMLNAVRYHGFFVFVLSVHCAHAPGTIISTVGPSPNSSSDMKPTAYPVEIVDTELVSGRSILIVCAAIDAIARTNRIHGRSNAPARADTTQAAAPAAMTVTRWIRAARGRSRKVNAEL